MDDVLGNLDSASAGITQGAENGAFLSLASTVLPFYLIAILNGATF